MQAKHLGLIFFKQTILNYTGKRWLNLRKYFSCKTLSLKRKMNHRVLKEWQWPISEVHSIMTGKISPGWGGGGGVQYTPTTFHTIYQPVQICSVHAS
jgi:hypothetical protein